MGNLKIPIPAVNINLDANLDPFHYVKGFREAQLLNEHRRFLANLSKEVPELSENINNVLTSLSRLHEASAYTTVQDSEAYRSLVSSTIRLNHLTEQVAASRADVLETFGSNFAGVAKTFCQSANTVVASAGRSADGVRTLAKSSEQVVREIHGIRVIGQSFVDRIDYYGRWMQTTALIQIAQNQQAIQVLTDISDHLRESNTIAVSGCGGSDGFASHVYDFIKQQTEEAGDGEGKNRRFFVYHPDTNWYGSFHRLIRQNPLPATFCAKSDNLDTMCQYMLDVRAHLKEESDSGKDVIFHLLIPSWCCISIKEPLHFPDGLQPFRIEGMKHKGKPLVELNLPRAPRGLLHGVANILDPRNMNKMAEGVSVAVTLPTVGWG